MGFPASYPNWVFSLFAFIGFFIVCIPFPWHFEAWNTGTCLYMAWTAIACLNQFINSVVWNKTAINFAPVWCDISSRIIIGASIAIPASSLCINRRLYRIFSVRRVMITKAEKRRQVFVDLAIGLGLPILEMILQIISEGHRFNIYEEIGCYPYTYNTWVAILTVWVPPIIIGLVSAVYASLSIRAFYQTRVQSQAILSVYSNLSSGRYLRLMALSACEILCTIPLGIYLLQFSVSNGNLRPWISWADTHSGYSRVDQTPSLLWRSNPMEEKLLEMTRWLNVACALLFFCFFGFADEARSRYRSAASTIGKHLGISTRISSSTIYASQMSKAGTGSESTIGANEKCSRETSSGCSASDPQSSDHLPPANAPATNGKKSHNLFYVFGKKKFNEEVFKPTFCYDDLVLPDIGGTLANEPCEVPPALTPELPPTSSISIPQHTTAFSEASGTDVTSPVPSLISEEPRKTHDMV